MHHSKHKKRTARELALAVVACDSGEPSLLWGDVFVRGPGLGRRLRYRAWPEMGESASGNDVGEADGAAAENLNPKFII